ncbi:unnamed protein product, partial [Staurois parvus]
MNGKQRTLFQAWGSTVAPEPQAKEAKPAKRRKGVPFQRNPNVVPPPPAWQATPQLGEDEDDDVLLVAVYEAEKTLNEADHAPDPLGSVLHPSGAPDPLGSVPHPSSASDPLGTGHHPDIQNLPGFDLSAGRVWIYPTNYPIREYQLTMAHTSLFHNTLVCLPTGLGKTFIAAVVMYNFYRWYPSGKIVFMAPTKPLVAQQIEACFRVMGIPQEHMVVMTGNTQVQKRKDMWHSHRVFFLTPQVM